MSVMSNQSISMNGVKEARSNSGEVFRPAGVPLNSRVGSVVIVLLRKKVGGESGLEKLIEL